MGYHESQIQIVKSSLWTWVCLKMATPIQSPRDLTCCSRLKWLFWSSSLSSDTSMYQHGIHLFFMIIHNQCDFLCLTIHFEEECDCQKCEWKNFDTCLNPGNYESLWLPWAENHEKNKRWNHKLQYHTWRPWRRCKWRRLDAHHSGERSPCSAGNGNWRQDLVTKYPGNMEMSPSTTEIVDAPSGW